MSDSTGFSADYIVNQFCALQSSNATLTPKDFLEQHVTSEARNFALEVVIADVQTRIRNGLPLDIEAYFDQFPELQHREKAWRILDVAEPWLVVNKGPNWKDYWINVFPPVGSHRPEPVNATDDASGLPDLNDLEHGDRVLHFTINRLVGKGTYGVVYHADNAKLARDVALKITPHGGNEGRALARLNHTNIVRVFGQHEIGSKRILEMEFVDGSSLDKWIATRYDSQSNQNSPKDKAANFLKWAAQNASHPPAFSSQEDAELPKSLNTPAKVAVWIVLQLANGLTHAHQRGIFHQDIKPANVLIDAKGNPLLTDFNVAFIDGQNRSEGVGGTINYMSPEHLRAFCSGDRDSVDSIDLRSDIYSLGIVLLELLGGDKLWGKSHSVSSQALAGDLLAARQKSTPEISQLPSVNQTLQAIVEKALQPAPENRYQSAGDLAADLSNWLQGRSNNYANNPSVIERATRFVLRHKMEASALLGTIFLALAAICGWLFVENSRLRDCERLLAEVESSLSNGRGAYAAEKLGVAKTQLEQLWISPLFQQSRLEQNYGLAEQYSADARRLENLRFSFLFGQASLLGLHQDEQQEIQPLVEESLKRYGVMSDPAWQRRPPFSVLSHAKQAQVAEHITELMLVSMIYSRRKQEPASEQWELVFKRLPEQHQSFDIFQEIKKGNPPRNPTTSDSSSTDSFELYLQGVWSTAEGDDKSALGWYGVSLDNQQDDSREKFWLRYRAGLSAQRLGLYQEAESHYNVCLGMKPDFAWLPFNLALVFAENGESQRAKNSLLRAVYLDAKMSAAYQALATLFIEDGEYDQALSICQRADAAGITSPEITRLEESARIKMKQ